MRERERERARARASESESESERESERARAGDANIENCMPAQTCKHKYLDWIVCVSRCCFLSHTLTYTHEYRD